MYVYIPIRCGVLFFAGYFDRRVLIKRYVSKGLFLILQSPLIFEFPLFNVYRNIVVTRRAQAHQSARRVVHSIVQASPLTFRRLSRSEAPPISVSRRFKTTETMRFPISSEKQLLPPTYTRRQFNIERFETLNV